MRFYNFVTNVYDEMDTLPQTPEDWAAYLPNERQPEFWLKMQTPGAVLEHVVLDMLMQEVNKGSALEGANWRATLMPADPAV